jgi:flagellin-like hook-associated protein FlgL
MRIGHLHSQISGSESLAAQAQLQALLSRANAQLKPDAATQAPDTSAEDATAFDASNQQGIRQQNLDAAVAPIGDTEEADEATAYAAQTIQQQPEAALQAQANQLPQTVLDLLQE